MSHSIPLLLLLLALPMFAVAQGTAGASDSPSEIDRVYQAFSRAYQTLDAAAAADLYTEDALYLSPNAEIRRGRNAIRPFFEQLFAGAREDGAKLDISFEFAERRREGSLAYDVGIYTVTSASAERTSASRGKFVTVLRRDDGGRWRIAVDTYNALPKPPQP